MNSIIVLKRGDSTNKDFIQLVSYLDQELAIRDGKEYEFYHQYNLLDDIKFTLIAYLNDVPIGCGAIKKHNASTMEIKRMFTDQKHRGKGVASTLLLELEQWTMDLSFEKCILETGKYLHDAIALYRKNGYHKISNYGQYRAVDTSVCFEKKLLIENRIIL